MKDDRLRGAPLAGASTGVRATIVHHYSPFHAGRLAPGLTVRARAAGYCWTGSANAWPRRDAWRCVGPKKGILDPCFSGAKAANRYVVCPHEAWNAGVLLLELTHPLPREAADPGGRSRVWSIVTTTGQHCNRVEGALPQIHGKVLRFECDRPGSFATEPDTSTPLWTAFYARNQTSTRLIPVRIRDAWR